MQLVIEDVQPVDRNSAAKNQKRLDGVRKWDRTDIDLRKKCVFLDEPGFHIIMKRSMAWSKKGASAVVIIPKTRAKTTTILGAVSASGIIKRNLRLPQPHTKKRKRVGQSGVMIRGTVTGHYLSFLKAAMDETDKYEHMKDHYLVMDNAPTHKAEDVSQYIERRGYRCAYLPSYSPELNPIEQFPSIIKSKRLIWALGGTVVWLHPRRSPTMALSRCLCCFCRMFLSLIRRHSSLFLPSTLPPSHPPPTLKSSRSFLSSLSCASYCRRTPNYLSTS